MIASRVRTELDFSHKPLQAERARGNINLKNVAVLPVSRSIPIDAFARKLHAALEGIGAPTAYLNQAAVSDHLGRHAFTRMGKLKAAGWLAEQEQKYRIVLYIADSAVSSSWTQTCIRQVCSIAHSILGDLLSTLQADCVMVVGTGDDPSIGEYERLLLSLKTTARKELVLLHPDRSVLPGSTREWLKVWTTVSFCGIVTQFPQLRPWVHQHIHVELPVCPGHATRYDHSSCDFAGNQPFRRKSRPDASGSCCRSRVEKDEGSSAERDPAVSRNPVRPSSTAATAHE